MVDLILECKEGRALRILLGKCDFEGEEDVGVRRVVELYGCGITCGA